MMQTFGEKIKEARKIQNLTQKQLADAIGAKHNSISDWENDKNKPDPDTIELLCGVLKITPNYLLKSSKEDFSPKEKLTIKKYRELDTHGKEMVDFTLEKEWERSKALAKQKGETIPMPAKEDTPDYIKPRAAHNDHMDVESETEKIQGDLSMLEKK